MNQVCFDNNIYVGILSPDEDKAPYTAIIDEYYREDFVFFAPAYLPAEFFQVLHRKVSAGLFDMKTKSAAEALFQNLNIVLLFNAKFVQLVLQVQQETGLSYFDSGYIACALHKDTLLITRDKELAKKGHKVYKNIQLI